MSLHLRFLTSADRVDLLRYSLFMVQEVVARDRQVSKLRLPVDRRSQLTTLRSLIAYPYPPPRHCEPPSEDITRYPLCRPIPPRSEALSATTLPPPRRSQHARSASYSDEDLPTSSTASDLSDFPLTPPGLSDRFIPAIHGCDIPKASIITINRAAPAPAAPPQSDADDDNDNEPGAEDAETGLCSAHGTLCVSGICKECAARKREARHAEKMLQREAERSWRGRGRGHGHGHHQPGGRGNAAPGNGTSTGTAGAKSRAPDVPSHLRREGGAKAPSSEKEGAAPRARLREDIRVEMASRGAASKQAAKSVASSATRALPPHLRKGSSQSRAPASSGVSASVSASSGPSSPSASAVSFDEDCVSESSITSESPPSCSEISEDCSLLVPSYRPSVVFDSSDALQPDTRRPGAQQGSGRAYADIIKLPAKLVPTRDRATDDVSDNPSKQLGQPARQPAPRRWADDVEDMMSNAGVRAAWDDDSSEDELY